MRVVCLAVLSCALALVPAQAQEVPDGPPVLRVPSMPSPPPGATKQPRFGVPDGADPVLPVPGIYPAEGPEGTSPATLARTRAMADLVNAVLLAETWQDAETVAAEAVASAPTETPRYVLEQSAGMALLLRPDYLGGPPTAGEIASAGQWLDRLNETRYAHLPDLLRLVEAVEGTWPRERVRAAAARAVASDHEWQIRQSALTQMAAWAATVEGVEPVLIPSFPDGVAEATHVVAHRRLVDLAE
ncbi:hypothetical protein [Rubrivirga sp.]|uniref:hypothetical protein n=1 Tax=Rubrivirga sp. TaxID=1885344 RepID=UPI003B5174EC